MDKVEEIKTIIEAILGFLIFFCVILPLSLILNLEVDENG